MRGLLLFPVAARTWLSTMLMFNRLEGYYFRAQLSAAPLKLNTSLLSNALLIKFPRSIERGPVEAE
jgi:hypothetical protein